MAQAAPELGWALDEYCRREGRDDGAETAVEEHTVSSARHVGAKLVRPRMTDSGRLLAFRLANYVTNHVIAHIPSFTIRHLWYQHIVGIRIGRHTWVHLGCYVWFYGRGETTRRAVSIGSSSLINRKCTIDVRGGLNVGSNVNISPEVMILTASHLMNDPSFKLVSYPVVIEDYAWIGSRATILPNITIGRGAVVAAGSVVTRDVAPMTVVAGVPAKPIGKRETTSLEYKAGGGVPPLFE